MLMLPCKLIVCILVVLIVLCIFSGKTGKTFRFPHGDVTFFEIGQTNHENSWK